MCEPESAVNDILLMSVEELEQMRVYDLHRVLFPGGGICHGWDTEINLVKTMKYFIDSLDDGENKQAGIMDRLLKIVLENENEKI